MQHFSSRVCFRFAGCIRVCIAKTVFRCLVISFRVRLSTRDVSRTVLSRPHERAVIADSRRRTFQSCDPGFVACIFFRSRISMSIHPVSKLICQILISLKKKIAISRFRKNLLMKLKEK